MADWFFPCNVNAYDVFGAFREFSKINWKQSSSYVMPNDIVYIYVGKPHGCIKYRCLVNKIDIEGREIDDSKYIIDGSGYMGHSKCVEIELLEEYKDGTLSREILRENGLKQVQGQHRISSELSAFLRERSQNYIDNSDRKDFEELNDIIEEDKEEEVFYKGEPKDKATPVFSGGRNVFPRDKKIAFRALKLACYKCEFDADHATFIRKGSELPYTEPHHLVPLSKSEQFPVSLDVEENIVSLCSHCHNEIHYGKNFRILLEKLFELRKEMLKSVGIDISLEELLNMYR